MSRADPESAALDPETLDPDALDREARTRWAAHARAAWARVRIDFVETTPCPTGRRVRAVVHLDGLTPADVVVGLTPGTEVGTAACSADRRMWSAEPLDNGCFVFERTIPRAEDVGGGEWAVCVWPVERSSGRPVVYPLRLRRSATSAACSTPGSRGARPGARQLALLVAGTLVMAALARLA